MAVGAAIAVPNWHNMAKNPPVVSTITTPATTTAPTEGSGTMMASPEGTTTTTSKQQQPQTAGPIAGATTVSILQGASTQGNPNYDPSDGKVPLGNKVVWQNKDTVPHTATSGTGPSDSSSGKMFDTKIINPAASSDPQVLNGVKQGDVVSYYCQIHPYMTAKLTITAATAGGGGAATAGGGGNATTATSGAPAAGGGGVSLSILQGASTQGNPAYSPNPLTVKKGDSISVVNKDAVPHTVTNGKDPSDPNSAKLFDTSIINAGQSAQITTTKLSAGQQYPFHCTVHPYMTGTLKVS